MVAIRVRQDDDLPMDFRLETEPMELPSPKAGKGLYKKLLHVVANLEPTTEEEGMSPRRTWYCKDKREMDHRMQALRSAKRNDLKNNRPPLFRKVSMVQRQIVNEKGERKFIIFLWNQG